MAIAPSFAPPYAAMAHTLIGQVQMGLIAPPEAMPKIYQNNMKALTLDPDFAESHYMNAILSMVVEWDWEKSELEYRKSLDGNPNHSLSHAYFAHLLLILRRFDEAIASANQSLALDPNNPLVQALAGVVNFHTGHIDRAFDLLSQSHQIDPNNILAIRILETIHYHKQEYDQAFALQKKIQQFDPAAVQALEAGYADQDYKQAMSMLAQSKEKRSETQFVQPGWVALTYMRTGQYDKALNWLEKAFQMHDQDLPYTFVVEEFAPLRSDPRFTAIAQKMNLSL